MSDAAQPLATTRNAKVSVGKMRISGRPRSLVDRMGRPTAKRLTSSVRLGSALRSYDLVAPNDPLPPPHAPSSAP